jgi:hypothetical protein
VWEDAAFGADGIERQALFGLLQLLLPSASPQRLDYLAAMLMPVRSSHVDECSLMLSDLEAEAAECRRLELCMQQEPAAEATRCLRELATALGSRSLDLAAAFEAAEEERVSFQELVRSGHACQMACI